MTLAAVTRRVDAPGGFREEAAFLPFRGAEVFTMTRLARGDGGARPRGHLLSLSFDWLCGAAAGRGSDA